MSTKIYQALAIVLLLLFASSASAAITCSLNSTGFSSAYVPSNSGNNVTPASVTMNCNRNVSGDATTQAFSVRPNNGNNPAGGGQNQATLGATTNRIAYDLYTDAGCTSLWRNRNLAGTVTMGGGTDFSPYSVSLPYYGCIGPGQNPAQGTYSDLVTMLPSIGPNAAFSVSIFTPASCSFAVAPGPVAFSYTAFQTLAAQATNTTFSANCTNLLPYQLALDGTPIGGVYPGIVSGLIYGLSISTTAGGAAILPADTQTGSGLPQTYYINGVMASGQAGTCASASCAGSVPRSLTITY